MTRRKTDRTYSLEELCQELSISTATGKNWIRLGKLTPDCPPLFSSEYVENIKDELARNINPSLKSRRNKKFVSGYDIYSSYISGTSDSALEIKKLISAMQAKNMALNENEIALLCSHYAAALIREETGNEAHRYLFLAEEMTNGDRASEKRFREENQWLFDFNIKYEENHDVLGLLYISCRNLRDRKITGSYFTPETVVKKLIYQLQENITPECRILDPCCGTGNFLLNIPHDISPYQLYGMDLDDLSIKITRLNIALRWKIPDSELMHSHFIVKNSLTDTSSDFSLIIGNPPWGTQGDYDQFMIKGIQNLKDGGTLSLIVPQSLLNVRKHSPTRKFILENAIIKKIIFLGDIFHKVNCPAIILQLRKSHGGHSLRQSAESHIYVENQNQSFESNSSYLSAENFIFLNNEDKKIIEKMDDLSGKIMLRGQSCFALGIVTGNNSRWIRGQSFQESEPVLTGTEILPFKCLKCKKFIRFTPDNFQQVAQEKYYRAPEKLVYRFISKIPTFAYDNKQMLTLNSCNILIPDVPGYSMKYILGILNSKAAAFYFQKKYNSIKMLREHIENLPIPPADSATQERIIKIVNDLISSINTTANTILLNNEVSALYGIVLPE
ncbi:MAG: N-6 DNA methylase [Spirochaetia bacterium]|nr:N-6 DNA methylase [Spirochaetia bacterium]